MRTRVSRLRIPVGAPERRVNSITYVIELDYKNLFNMYIKRNKKIN